MNIVQVPRIRFIMKKCKTKSLILWCRDFSFEDLQGIAGISLLRYHIPVGINCISIARSKSAGSTCNCRGIVPCIQIGINFNVKVFTCIYPCTASLPVFPNYGIESYAVSHIEITINTFKMEVSNNQRLIKTNNSIILNNYPKTNGFVGVISIDSFYDAITASIKCGDTSSTSHVRTIVPLPCAKMRITRSLIFVTGLNYTFVQGKCQILCHIFLLIVYLKALKDACTLQRTITFLLHLIRISFMEKCK